MYRSSKVGGELYTEAEYPNRWTVSFINLLILNFGFILHCLIWEKKKKERSCKYFYIAIYQDVKFCQ